MQNSYTRQLSRIFPILKLYFCREIIARFTAKINGNNNRQRVDQASTTPRHGITQATRATITVIEMRSSRSVYTTVHEYATSKSQIPLR